MRLTLLFRILPRFARLMSSRTSGGMLSALTSRVGNLALRQNVSYRVALEETIRTFLCNLADEKEESLPCVSKTFVSSDVLMCLRSRFHVSRQQKNISYAPPLLGDIRPFKHPFGDCLGPRQSRFSPASVA